MLTPLVRIQTECSLYYIRYVINIALTAIEDSEGIVVIIFSKCLLYSLSPKTENT